MNGISLTLKEHCVEIGKLKNDIEELRAYLCDYTPNHVVDEVISESIERKKKERSDRLRVMKSLLFHAKAVGENVYLWKRWFLSLQETGMDIEESCLLIELCNTLGVGEKP